jgi:protoheme IX farnesyltransferase
MMPVVAGVKSTRHQILGYAVLLLPLTLVPWYIGAAGNLFGISALALSSIFLFYSAQVGLRTSVPGDKMVPEKRLFAYSIFYLFILFGALVVDRFATLGGFQS